MSGIKVANIDYNKIDLDRLYRGEKTDWLNLVLKDNKNGRDQYGNDGFVIQDQTKEERQAGVRAEIIGNWKYLGEAPRSSAQNRPEQPDDRAAQRRRPEPPPRRPYPRRERPMPTRPARDQRPPQKPAYDPNEPDIDDPNF